MTEAQKIDATMELLSSDWQVCFGHGELLARGANFLWDVARRSQPGSICQQTLEESAQA